MIISILTAFLLNMSVTAHAGEMLERDYIESEIWQEMWLGRDDDGTEFPEASFKHHLLDEWIDQNYGSDEYNWFDIGELEYAYKDYYNDYTEDWDFNDDDNGNWMIETDEHTYSFTMFQNEWLMLDENGNTVDTFPPFSTLKSEPEKEPISGDSGEENDNTPKVRSSFDSGAETASDEPDSESMEFDKDSTENASESCTDDSDSITPLIVGAVIIIIIGAVGIYLYQRKK
ncbi:MAG: hypothetical protein IJJ69_11825 [Oscillospiraceae bacterium]|nr:hypothetical protein [Oscillospiraceae bacterium]